MINGTIKLRKLNNKFNILLFISLFIFSFQIRGMFFRGNAQNFNLLAVISIFCIFTNSFTKNNKYMFLCIITCIINILLSQKLNGKGIIENITVISCLIVPLFLIISNTKSEQFEKIFFQYVKILNSIIVILFVVGMIDKLTDNGLGKIIANIINDKTYIELINSYGYNRYYSFMGHPLYNTQLFLMFYLINLISKKYFKMGLNINIVILISVLGISFTASKTGLILLGLALMFTSPFKNKVSYYCVMLCFIILIFKLGIFDIVIDRFKYGTLTSGRNEVWDIVNAGNYISIKFFTGYGSGFNNEINYFITTGSAAFEYPIRLYSLEYGVVSTILIYIIIFIYPIIVFIKNKQYVLIMSFLIVFADVNTYNGIGLGMDIMLMFCTYIYILLNLARYLKSNNISLK